MDGGRGHEPESTGDAQNDDTTTAGAVPGESSREPSRVDELAVRVGAAGVRAAADAQALAEDALVGELLRTLETTVGELAQVRWSPRSAQVMAAAVRAVAAQQARLDAAFLSMLNAVDDRDDVVPRQRSGHAAAALLKGSLGWDTKKANRETRAARLLRPALSPATDGDGIPADSPASSSDPCGDLGRIGAAYAAGTISRGHVDVAVSVQGRLKDTIRESLTPDPDGAVDPETGEVILRRCIDVVDATLARYAPVFSVTELSRIGNHLVETLDPPTPDGAHERRYLYWSRLPDGSLVGKFACGPEQGHVITSVLDALAKPRPGVAVDADGVEHHLRDERTPGQRSMDSLVEAIRHNHGRGTPDEADGRDDTDDHTDDDDTDGPDTDTSGATSGATDETGELGDEYDGPDGDGLFGIEDPPAPPDREGEHQVRRPPGARTSPYPDVEIVLTATLEQLAHARALHALCGEPETRGSTLWPPGAGPNRPERPDAPDLSAARAGFARTEHGEPVHPSVLGMLSCSGRLRTALLDEHGAVLNLGRSARLATRAQRRALAARDGGCAIPACGVPAARCEIHHLTAWVDGGATDLTNLVMLCALHHVEITKPGHWQIEMIRGVPWARPPAWVNPARPLLRNATHHGIRGT